MKFVMTQDVDAPIFFDRRDEAIAETQLFAQRRGLRFRGDKRIGAAVDDESVTTFGDAGSDDTLLAILEDRPCEPFSETIDGRVTEGLRFSDITFEDLAALPSAAGDLSQLPADMKQSGEYTLWLAEVDGLLLSVRTRLTLTFDVGDGVSVIEAVTAMSDFNKPLTITAPADIATPVFALDLARPDDAAVIVEDSLVLVFLTQEPPEEIKTFYTQALTAEGWTLDENRKSSISGSNADLLSFSRGEERMEMAISVSDDGETVVSFILIPAE